MAEPREAGAVSSDYTTGLASRPEVLIVILNWNSPEDTITAVESALKMDYPAFRIAVIDNGSTVDPTESLAPILGDRVTLITSPENLGFSGGCNLGIGHALETNCSYVWLLNSDSVTESTTLSSLVALAESDPKIGMVSPLIFSMQEPTKLVNAGGIYYPDGPHYDTTKKLEQALDWAKNSPQNVTLIGTAILIRLEVVRKIGKLDHELFAYFEDADYSIRSIGAGYRNAVDFNSSVYHMMKPTALQSPEIKPHFLYYMARNEILFWKKYAQSVALLKRIWWAYGYQLKNLRQLTGNQRSRQAILAGIWDGLINKKGAYSPTRRMPTLLAAAVEFHSRHSA
jgi:GT2 family glycosyltransferase